METTPEPTRTWGLGTHRGRLWKYPNQWDEGQAEESNIVLETVRLDLRHHICGSDARTLQPYSPSSFLDNNWKPLDVKRIKNKSQLCHSDIPDISLSAKNFIPKQLQHRLDPDEIVELIAVYQVGTLMKDLTRGVLIDRIRS